MTQRIFTLSGYLFRSLLFSLAGLLYILVALAFYKVFFDPPKRTPDTDYYILVIGIFGMALTFLTTLSVAARANKAIHLPLLVRLPSRVEYLAAVLLAALVFAGLLQLFIAFLALVFGAPALSLRQALEIPPLWLSVNVLIAVLALHASDLVTAGWSRVYVYGLLAILLYGQEGADVIGRWLAAPLRRLASLFATRGWIGLSTPFSRAGEWTSSRGGEILEQLLGFVFWPFEAVTNATIQGFFSRTQALAPAILLLYATILFLLAADFLATKDLFLTE
ncbi:MAG: hypothetical protein L0332_16325 [Chloroflexi bacterium]|nr:hypothetical protein [Chloroflexota bacterium]MCI0580074.1 hypothetical protein [Chloroflexota bacterium]MCI0643496.1 hypothetical protein [Chloroflexota bacterium]MCI0728266.1 hypothetical protein [Chloroflexota bacterium]